MFTSRPLMPVTPVAIAAVLGLPHGYLVAQDAVSGRAGASWTREWQVWYDVALVGLFGAGELAGILKNRDLTTTGMLCGAAGLTNRLGIGLRHRQDAGATAAYVAQPYEHTSYAGRPIAERHRAHFARLIPTRVVGGTSVPVATADTGDSLQSAAPQI